MSSSSEGENRSPGVEMTLRKKTFFSLATVFFCLLAVELGLHAVAFVLSPGKGPAVRKSPQVRVPWAKERLPAFYENPVVYEPFREWRMKKFSGEYIHISPDGIRKTYNPSFSNGQEIKKVFCFGGSTMWGSDARDEFTLPSLLSKKLNQDKPRFQVTNYGQCAYTLTQEVVHLTLLLKEGNIPDYVIFYDGVNDISSAYKSGEPGKIHDLAKIRLKMGGGGAYLWSQFASFWEENCMIYRALLTLRALLNKQAKTGRRPYSAEETQSLSDAIIADYVKNVRLVDALSKGFGFRYVFFWQPMLLTNAAPTEEELASRGWRNKGMVDFFRLTYEKAQKIQLPHFHNISRLLDGKRGTLYVDYCHLCEEGNEIVANEICQVFRKELGE